MKSFIRERSYDMLRLFLNQFAIAVFGLALTLPMGTNTGLRNLVSVLSILFYLFLLYYFTWEIGFKDRSPIKNGVKKKNVLTGLYIALGANVLNFLLALLICVGQLFPTVMGKVGGVSGVVALFVEAMYMGVLSNKVGDVPLNAVGPMYFAIILPALIVCTVAYIMGLNDITKTGLFRPVLPDSDRDIKQKPKKADVKEENDEQN